jgi:hypothetical protein
MLRAEAAKKQNIKSQVYLNTQQAARLKGAVVELTDVHVRIETLYKVLTKIHENASVSLLDTKQAVELQEDKWKAIRQSYKAMDSAMKALKGDKDERALFEETMEFINSDLSTKMGEIEYMLDSSAQIMDSIDVENGMFREKGMKMLEEFEKKSDSWLLGSDNQSTASVALSKIRTNDIGQIETTEEGKPNNFSSLFGNK